MKTSLRQMKARRWRKTG